MEYTEEHIRKLSTEHGLSKEQIIEFIAEFKAYDTDRNGAITSIDLGVVNKAFGGNTTDDTLEGWINEIDSDGDAKIDFHEFLKFNAMSIKKKKDKETNFDNEIEKEIRQVFRELDKDGNGFISAAELKHGMMASLDKKIDSMIKEADVDGDGQINFLEFDKVNSGPSKINKAEEEVLSPPKPPDGGWGWVIVLSCFMCNFIVEGFGYTFGVLLDPLVTSFNAERSSVALVGSILSGVNAMIGPIIGGLTNKFGMRTICISGCIIGCIGLSISQLSNSVLIFTLTLGVIGGIGGGAITLPANVAVGYYFEKKRAIATGITQCGSSIGQFVFVPLAGYFIKHYDWTAFIWFVASLYLICSIFGAFLRPLVLKEEEYDENGTKKKLKPASFGTGNGHQQHVNPFSRKDLYYRGSSSALMKANSAATNTESTWDDFRHLLFTTPRVQESKNEEQTMLSMIKGMMNIELMIKPLFLMIIISSFLGMLGFFVPIMFLPDMATLKGIEASQAGYLISIYAISNMIGKLFTGWFSDISWVDQFSLFNSYILLSGAAVCFLPLCTSFVQFAVVAALYGFFTSFFMLKTIVLVELLGLENLTSAYSLLNLFEGIAGISGAPIAGALFDAAKSYDIPFYIAGSCFILASFISLGAQILHRRQKNMVSNKLEDCQDSPDQSLGLDPVVSRGL